MQTCYEFLLFAFLISLHGVGVIRRQLFTLLLLKLIDCIHLKVTAL